MTERSPDSLSISPDKNGGVTLGHDELLRRAQNHYELMAVALIAQNALTSIKNVLGPEICTCETACPGLQAEAHDALTTAVDALARIEKYF